MKSLTKIINTLDGYIDSRLTKRFDSMFKKSPIMAMFARHLESMGERFSIHAVAINQSKMHIADLQKQVDLLCETMTLMIQAKSERVQGSFADHDDFQNDMPN